MTGDLAAFAADVGGCCALGYGRPPRMRSDERGCDVDAVVWFVSEVSGIGKVFPFEEIGFFSFSIIEK